MGEMQRMNKEILCSTCALSLEQFWNVPGFILHPLTWQRCGTISATQLILDII